MRGAKLHRTSVLILTIFHAQAVLQAGSPEMKKKEEIAERDSKLKIMLQALISKSQSAQAMLQQESPDEIKPHNLLKIEANRFALQKFISEVAEVQTCEQAAMLKSLLGGIKPEERPFLKPSLLEAVVENKKKFNFDLNLTEGNLQFFRLIKEFMSEITPEELLLISALIGVKNNTDMYYLAQTYMEISKKYDFIERFKRAVKEENI